MKVKADCGWLYFGASVRGPGHILDRLPNQDAWLGYASERLTYMVVSDGLGSRPLSHIGSRAACRAVAQALGIWATVPGAPTDKLLRLVHLLWALRIHPHSKDQCCATCLFAAVTPSSGLILCKLGDGLIQLLRPDGSQLSLDREEEDFTNETTALGVATSLEPWTTRQEPACPPGTTVLICTDGVADDLQPRRLAAFSEHVRNKYAGVSQLEAQALLAAELRGWATPGHTDDKTLACMWRAGVEEQDG